MSSARTQTGRAWQSWQMGQLERRVESPPRNPEDDAPAQRRVDQITGTLVDLAREKAEQDGYEAGYARGLADGKAEGDAAARAECEQELKDRLMQQTSAVSALVGRFGAAMDELHDQVGYQLVELAIETGQQLAGRALDLKPEHILDDIEELLATHPSLSGAPVLLVPVADVEQVQAYLGETLATAGWSIRADATLERGDCRIETEECEVDATIEDRWARLLHVVGHGEH